LVVAGGIVLLAANRSDGGRCEAEAHERQDPRSLQHVLPGAPPPSFGSAAPTSGPHQVGFIDGGVRSEPIAPAVQVGALEAGAVLVQHTTAVADRDLTSLGALAGGRVIVAPNAGLDAPVVATAWQTRLRCSSVDVARLRRFIREHTRVPAAAHP
jgi:hypothetical protein